MQATVGECSVIHSTVDNTSLSLGLIQHLRVSPIATGNCRGHCLMPHGYLKRILHRQCQECRIAEAKQEDPDVHDYFLHWFLFSPFSLSATSHSSEERSKSVWKETRHCLFQLCLEFEFLMIFSSPCADEKELV